MTRNQDVIVYLDLVQLVVDQALRLSIATPESTQLWLKKLQKEVALQAALVQLERGRRLLRDEESPDVR